MKSITVLLIILTLPLGCMHHPPDNPLLKQYKKALRVEPSAKVWNELGLLYEDKGDLAAGENAFRKALKLDPKSPTIHNNLGAFLARRGNLQGALEQFQETADTATAHNNLAVVLYETGQFEQSLRELVKALAIQSDLGPALANFKLVQQRIERRPEKK